MNPILLGALIALGVIALLLVLGFAVWLFMLLPGRRRDEIDKYKSVKFAHRGLHDATRAENSISAFRAARDAGFGIELDVRLAGDGELVVFHDPDLNRVCGVDRRVIDMTTSELREVRLSGTDDCVPTFREVLELIDGRVPLLIEIKMDMGESGIAEKLVQVIEGYKGDYIVESFNPLALRTVKKARPDVLRGILSTEYMKEKRYRGKLLYLLLENLLCNFLMRPDFIAYEKGGAKNKRLRYLRHYFGTPLFAWTVRSPEEEKRAMGDGFDTVIFEGYIPER